jgi:hypothetical protein
MRMATAFVVGLGIVSCAAGLAAVAAEPPKSAPQRALAEAFVRSLSDAERKKALRPLDHPERTKWYFARGGREGLFLRDMDADTRAATLALVDGFLSASGREQWRLIRVVEAINAVDEKAAGASPPTYGDDLYAVHLFGSPEAAAWAFEIEGHHFVLHAAVVDGVATVTPMFTGSFPAEIARGDDKGRRPLGAAVEVAFELARSFDDAQRKVARIMDATPADVLWAVGADAKAPEMKGVARASMSEAQKALVDKLLATHAGLLADGAALLPHRDPALHDRVRLDERRCVACPLRVERSRAQLRWRCAARASLPRAWRKAVLGALIVPGRGRVTRRRCRPPR